MSDELSIAEAAEMAGIPRQRLDQHIHRGKLRTRKVDGRTVVSEEDLNAYMVAEGLLEAADASRAKPIEDIASNVEVPLHVLISRLPADGQAALLEGIRTGSPRPFAEWKAKHQREMAGRKTVAIGDLPYDPKKAAAVPKGKTKIEPKSDDAPF
jgi:excisionase family DNA binding protein